MRSREEEEEEEEAESGREGRAGKCWYGCGKGCVVWCGVVW
jgi:hypothetical protein